MSKTKLPKSASVAKPKPKPKRKVLPKRFPIFPTATGAKQRLKRLEKVQAAIKWGSKGWAEISLLITEQRKIVNALEKNAPAVKYPDSDYEDDDYEDDDDDYDF